VTRPGASWLALAGLLLTATGLLLGCGSIENPERGDGYPCQGCNLILISIDTLRADHLGIYGYERPTSPHLGQLASEGILFENFIHNGGGTLPSHLTMLTGVSPVTHGIHPGNAVRLEDERITLAEQLGSAGYATAAFTDGGWMSRKFGFDQGFDVYDDTVVNGHFAATLPKARRWIEGHREKPFFLFLHTYDVHSEWKRLPYDCPGDFPTLYNGDYDGDFDGCRSGDCAAKLLAAVNTAIAAGRVPPFEAFQPDDVEYIKSLYDGCINYADERIGELVEFLKSLGIYDETVIAITSDHGEEFQDHGRFLHDQGGYEEFVRLTLIVRLPHSRFGDTRVPHLAAMIDLMPTLLAILDVPVGDQAQGSSLVPSIADDRAVRRSVHVYSVLRTDRWKYFRDAKELYDLEADPQEVNNVYDEQPKLLERLDAQLTAVLNEDFRAADSFRRMVAGGEAVELTEEERRNLEALGYLD